LSQTGLLLSGFCFVHSAKRYAQTTARFTFIASIAKIPRRHRN
jgi:hypothetical protein